MNCAPVGLTDFPDNVLAATCSIKEFLKIVDEDKFDFIKKLKGKVT